MDELDQIEELFNNSPETDNAEYDRQVNHYSGLMNELENQQTGVEDDFFHSELLKNNDYLPDDFAYDFSEVEDVNELQAQLQPWTHKAGSFVGRTAGKAVIEFAKGFGYLAGAPGAALTGDIETMTNNFFIDLMDSADESLKEALPVYVKNAVQDGSLGTKLMSMDFWANEGADGLGFLLSSIGLGGVMSKLGNLAKLGNTANVGVTSAVQTLVEAAAETSGMSTQLDHYWEGRLQDDGKYASEKLDANGNPIMLTAEQVKQKKASALHSTFIQNSILLAGPNFIMADNLFGKANPMKNMLGISKGSIPNIPKKAVTSLDEMTSKLNSIKPWKEGIKKGGLETLKVGSSEAFQELTQFAIEDYNSQLAKNLTNDGLISGLWDSYQKGLTETEGQASMALGFIFGAGASTIGSYKKAKADAKKQKGLVELISTANDSYKGALKSLYKINEDGNYEIDNEKVADVIDSNIKDLTLDDRYKKARAQGEKDFARYALGHIVMRTMQPFLEQEEGMEIFNQLIEENSDTYETDYKELGFSSVEEMKNYVKNIAKTAQAEHQKFQEKGYHKFGINKKVLYRGKENAGLIDEVYGRFLGSMNNLNQSLTFSRDRLIEERHKVEKELSLEESTLFFPELDPSSENYEKAKEVAIGNNKVVSTLRSKLTQLNQALNKVNQDYEKLYDKDEHEKTFNQLYFSRHALREAAQEDLAEREVVEESVNSFYDDLKAKGYTIESDGQGNDITKGAVSLIDNEGNVYLTGKGKLTPGGAEKFIIRNVSTGEVQEFTADIVNNLFPGTDNILSKEQFQDWKKTKKLVTKYEKAVKAINQFIGPVSGGRMGEIIEQRKEIFTQQQSLEFYQEYLKELKNEVPTRVRTLENIANEIEIAEKEIQKLESVIFDLNSRLELLEESLQMLEDIELEYIEGLSTFKMEGKNKPMSNMLSQLQEQFDNNEVTESVKLIKDSISLSNKILDDLYGQKLYLDDLLDDLYYVLQNNLSFDEIIENLDDKSIRKIAEILDLKDSVNKDLTSTSLSGVDILGNRGTRNEVLKVLNANKGDLWHTYNIIKSEQNTIKKNINRTLNSIDSLNKNIQIRVKYDQLSKDIASLNAIFKNIKFQEKVENFKKHEAQRSLPSQTDVAHANDYKSKNTPYSTTTSMYKFENGEVVLDSNGNKVKSDNWKQSARWSKAMVNVDLNEIQDYHLEFVDNSGLERLGITPPSSNEKDLYVVLHKNGEKIVVDGEIAFTGIAFTDTYFENTEARVNLTSNPDYLNALLVQKKVEQGKLDSFEYVKDDITYTSIESLEDHLKSEMKDDYSKWRDSISDKLSNGERLYSNITHVSKGHPILSDIKNKVEDSLGKVSKIIIPGSSTHRTNTTSFDVAPGMVHVENEKGHVKRVMNRRIDSLSQAEQKKTLDTILNFIALSAFTENKMNEEFSWKGSKSKMPLVGNAKKAGVLDYYINWGDSNKNWAINIGRSKKTNELQIRITNGTTDGNGKPIANFINVSDLFDGKISPETVRKSNDPVLQPLVDFLKTKYLNVSRESINKDLKYGFWLPTGWKIENGQPVITGEKKRWKTYNDYVLDKVLYTNVAKEDKENEIPNHVNQYAVFDKDEVTSNKPVIEKTEEIEDKPVSLKDMRKASNPIEDFNAAMEDFGSSTVVSVFGEEGGMSEQFAKMMSDSKEKEKDDTHCAKPSKVGPPKAPPGIKINKFKGEIL